MTMKVSIKVPQTSDPSGGTVDAPFSPDSRHPALRSCSSQDCSDQSEQDDATFSCESNCQSWARGLAGSKYFVPCCEHAHLKRNECTFFCVTCKSTKALCHQCLADHEDHHILQVRRYVYEDVVNTSDMKELINMEGIQTYTINQAPVIFVKDRPPTGTVRNNHKNGCVMCNRCLKPDYKFCSIACKVNAAESWDQPEIVQPLAGPNSGSKKADQKQREAPRRAPRGPRANCRRSSSQDAETINIKLPNNVHPDHLLRAIAHDTTWEGRQIAPDAADSSGSGSLKRKATAMAFCHTPSRRKQLSPRRSPFV